MSFTFTETNTNNTLDSIDLQISINPDTAIIQETYDVGDVAAGTIAVTNVGLLLPVDLYLTADWGPSAGTTDRMATLLANALAVSVTVSSATVTDTTVYTGRFIDMIDVSIFSSLTPGSTADVKISVAMPDDRTGPTLLDKAIHSDFVFVATPTI